MTVCDEKGQFRPLDQRTIDKLIRSDSQRKYAGKDPAKFAALFEKELDEHQAALDREKERAATDRMNEIMDRADFEIQRVLEHRRTPRLKVKEVGR